MALSRVNRTDLLQQNYEKTSVSSFSDGELNCVFDEPLSSTESPASTQTYPGLELSSNPVQDTKPTNPTQDTQQIKKTEPNTFSKLINELLGKKENNQSAEKAKSVNPEELSELTKLMNGLLGKNEADAIKNEYGRSEINKLPNLENYNYDFDALARSLNYDNASGRQGSLEQKLNEIDRSIALLRLQATSKGSSIDPRLQALDTRIDDYRAQMPTSSANPANMTSVGPIEGVKDIQPGNFGGVNLSGEQINNVKAIAAAAMEKAKKDNLNPEQTRTLLKAALMCAMQESTMKNVNYGDGAGPDSRGLFQQRANGEWGSLSDRMNPKIAATNFMNAMDKYAPDWKSTNDVTNAIYKTQRCAKEYAREYQKWEGMASALVTAMLG